MVYWHIQTLSKSGPAHPDFVKGGDTLKPVCLVLVEREETDIRHFILTTGWIFPAGRGLSLLN